MTATLAEQYITNLVDYLTAQAISDPPAEILGGLVQDGRYQDSPENHTYVATIHEGDPKDASRSGDQEWRHEINDKMPMEMPGCASHWFYRFTCHVQYFMTRTGEDQGDALENIRHLTQWFRKKLNAANVTVLSLSTSDYGETPYFVQVKAMEINEGGGPATSYIGRIVFFIEMHVHIPGG